MRKILEFLNNERLCVISSVNDSNNPESALVAFSENENLEIFIGTSSKSRKFKNIQKNNNVSIVFGFGGDSTLQYEGEAKFVDDVKDKLKSHFQKNPGSKRYENDPNQVYMLIRPKWARLTKSDPDIIDEVEFA